VIKSIIFRSESLQEYFERVERTLCYIAVIFGVFCGNLTSKMATCGVCNRSVKTNQLKISCQDCEKPFHGGCVKLSKNEIDYLSSDGNVWRCEPCSVTRRQSLRFESQLTEGGLTLEDVMKAINELRCENKQSVKDMNNSFELLHSKIGDNTSALAESNKNVTTLLERIEALTAENNLLHERVLELENRLDEQEQYSRRNCVEIHGIKTKPSDVMETVKSVGQAIGMNITESMLDACHLLGKKPNSDKPPAIILKFVRRFDAEEMLAKKRLKKDLSTRHLGMSTDTPVYINESLTPAKRRLLAMARAAKTRHNYKWLWVRGCKIFLRKEDNGPKKHVKCQADLDNL